jgi:hypothetical protein
MPLQRSKEKYREFYLHMDTGQILTIMADIVPMRKKRAASLAMMGAYVFTYDMVGYGEMADYGWEHRKPKTLKLQLLEQHQGSRFFAIA